MAEKQKPVQPVPLDLKLAKEMYAAQALRRHERFGKGGIRFLLGQTKCDIYPAPLEGGLGVVAVIRGRRSRLDIADVQAVTPMLHDEKGILVSSAQDAVWIKPDGSYLHEYQPLGATLQPGEQTRLPASARTDTRQSSTEKQPRIVRIGFYSKVLDGFPSLTADQRKMYKLLIGKKAADQPQEGKEKIDWVTVVALEEHVVKFLDENVAAFEGRKTWLRVEGYFQENEVKLKTKTKKVTELYALAITKQS